MPSINKEKKQKLEKNLKKNYYKRALIPSLEIASFEQKHKISLPSDYKYFLANIPVAMYKATDEDLIDLTYFEVPYITLLDFFMELSTMKHSWEHMKGIEVQFGPKNFSSDYIPIWCTLYQDVILMGANQSNENKIYITRYEEHDVIKYICSDIFEFLLNYVKETVHKGTDEK